jgi:D-alanyl-D-alanine carboxypeptidase
MQLRRLAPLILLAACQGRSDRAVLSGESMAVDSAAAHAILAPLVASHEFMGAVAFMRNGVVVYAEGAGMADVAAGRPFTPATPADGGSLAKTLTAASVWSLVHEGRIALDTPVTAYIPDFPHRGTTVRQLITHTNGLPPDYGAFDRYFDSTTVRTTPALLAAAGRMQPAPRFTPGTRFEYSNLGFDAAALVVERVSAKPIATVFRERYWAPLRMDSAFARPGRLADFPVPRTLGYRWADSAWTVLDVYENEAFIGASNVYFSALDLVRWGGANASGTALPEAVRALGTPAPIIDGHPSPINGLSWYCDASGERCYYTGAINAFHSLVYWDRTRNEAVSMISNSNLGAWTLVTLQRNLVATLAGRAVDRLPRPTFISIPERGRDSLAGRYATPSGDTIAVSARENRLFMRKGGGLEFEVFQVAPDEFYVPGPDDTVGFTIAGTTRRMHVRSMFTDFVAPAVH